MFFDFINGYSCINRLLLDRIAKDEDAAKEYAQQTQLQIQSLQQQLLSFTQHEQQESDVSDHEIEMCNSLFKLSFHFICCIASIIPIQPSASTDHVQSSVVKGPGRKRQKKEEDSTFTTDNKKPKRARKAIVISKTRKIQPVPMDEQGNVILPLQIGILTLHSLGKVDFERDLFHNERYIYPIGYTISRYTFEFEFVFNF